MVEDITTDTIDFVLDIANKLSEPTEELYRVCTNHKGIGLQLDDTIMSELGSIIKTMRDSLNEFKAKYTPEILDYNAERKKRGLID